MKKLGIIAYSTLLASLMGCGNKEQAAPWTNIDLSGSIPKEERILQDLFEIEYVALETTDSFLTRGFIEAVSQHFLITYDYNEGCLSLFDRTTGKGIRQIKRQGQGPEEFTSPSNVIIDEKREELFISDYSLRKILIYDMKGNFKRSFKTVDENYYTELLDYDDGHLLAYKSPSGPHDESSCHLLISKQDGSLVRVLPISIEKLVGTYVRTDGAAAVVFPPAGIVPNRGDWLLTDISADTVYSYIPSGDRMEPFLALIPSQDPVRLFAMGTVTDRYYFMEATRREFDFTTGQGFGKDYWAYDVLEKAVYSPVIQNADFKDGNQQYVSQLVLNGARLAVVHTLTADQLVSAYEEDNLNDGPLKDIASRLDMEDNPVLMLMKYKKP